MPHKSPENYSFITYVWVLGLSLWAGISSYLYKLQIEGKPFSLFSFVSDVLISGFVGILTFFFCEYSNMPPVESAVVVGVCAHLGTRAISLFQAYIIRKYFPKHCEKCNFDTLAEKEK